MPMGRSAFRPGLIVVLLAACGPSRSAVRPAQRAVRAPSAAPSRPSDHAVVLLAEDDGARCVAFETEGGLLRASAGDTCDVTTLTLGVTAQGALESVTVRTAHAPIANAMGAEGSTASVCSPTGHTQLDRYASLDACESARSAGAPPTVADTCLQSGVEALRSNDLRVAAVDDAALLRAMRDHGHLYLMAAGRLQTRRCVAWTFESEGVDATRGRLSMRGPKSTKSRSYRYDASCKSLGLSGFAVSGAQASATSDVCSVVGRLERANADAIDVGARRLFLTESACAAALNAPPGDVAPYVTNRDGC